MSVETVVETWCAAWNEPDAIKRATLLEQCCAPDVRFATSGRTYEGHAAISTVMAAVIGRNLRARITHPVEVQGQLFRVRGAAEVDGRVVGRNVDAGMVDASGRIATILTFVEPAE